MRLSFSAPATIFHVQFASDITAALKQPVTEIAFHTANSPEDRQKALEVFAELTESRNIIASYGAVEEKDNVAVFIAGWQSVEVKFCQFMLENALNGIVIAPTRDSQGTTPAFLTYKVARVRNGRDKACQVDTLFVVDTLLVMVVQYALSILLPSNSATPDEVHRTILTATKG
jgi:hypothetical protein